MIARAGFGDAQACLTRAMRWKKDECFVWPYARNQTGIPMIAVKVGAKKTNKSARRLVCESAYGDAPSKAHKAYSLCGNPLCIAPLHIEWRNARVEEAQWMAGAWTKEERAERSRAVRAAQSPEIRSEIGKKGAAALSPEQKELAVNALRAAWKSLPKEKKREIARKGGRAAAAAMTPERAAKMADSVRMAMALMPPEKRQERARKAQETRRQTESVEQRGEWGRTANAALTQKQRSENAVSGWARLTPEARAARIRAIHAWHNRG